jgi:hypothetical protein
VSQPARPTPASATSGSALTVLSFAGTHIVLARGDLRTIETATDVVRVDPPQNGVGWIAAFDRVWPAFALSADMVPLPDVPTGRRLCAAIGCRRGLFGLLCDEIQVVSEERLSFVPLPALMRGPASPFHAVAKSEKGIVFASDAEALGRHIGAAAVLVKGLPTAGRIAA